MLRPADKGKAQSLEAALIAFAQSDTTLPGVTLAANRRTLVLQLIESIRRIKLIDTLRNMHISALCTDPHSAAFNPIKAAIYHAKNGERDEAFWLIFLLTHFGKNKRQGWALLKAVYGKCGATPFWSWQEINATKGSFRIWLRQNQAALQGLGFGNHRKYESLREDSPLGLASVVESYIKWVGPSQSHDSKFQSIIHGINDPEIAFDLVYQDASELHRWGRLAKFDHLTMIGKIGLLSIKPGSTYLKGATGPKRGVALLLHNNPDTNISIGAAEELLKRLGTHLNVGQQELEDALCNWQKSPSRFVAFR